MLRDFVFSPSFGNRPSYLVGREDILGTFDSALQSSPGDRDRAMLLLGQRGSGKTVLLWELADRARKKGFVVASPTVVSENMLERIVEKIQDDGSRYVKGKGPKLSGGSIGALGFSVGLQFTRDVQETKTFQYKLTQLARRLSKEGHGILILVDELQANSPEARQLVISFQELVGEGLDVALVMAGLPGAVSATLNDKVLTFLNRARKVELGGLPLSDVEAYYREAFESLDILVDEDLRRRAAQATEGSPYMMQLVGHNIVLRAKPGEAVSEEVLAEALLRARLDFETDVCETTLAALSEVDVAFLQAMSDDAASSKTAEVAKRMDVSVDYAQKYRKRLIDAGVIEGAGWGSVTFAVPYLADYLRRQAAL